MTSRGACLRQVMLRMLVALQLWHSHGMAAKTLRDTGRRSTAHLRGDPEGANAGYLDISRFGSTSAMDTYLNATGGLDEQDQGIDLPVPNATLEAHLPRRTLVVARYDEDVSWLQHLPKNIDVIMYQSSDPSSAHYVENFGNEASKYLSYIVEHYDALPEVLAFVQAGRQDWHDVLPKDVMLRGWNWERVQENGGLVFMPTSAPCLIEDRDKMSPVQEQAQLLLQQPSKTHGQCMDVKEHMPKQMDAIKEAWPSTFESELGSLPARWLTHCCAQFEVTRDAIRRHSLSFYQEVLEWTLRHDRALSESDYADAMRRNHDPDRRDAGHILEPLWTLIFADFVS